MPASPKSNTALLLSSVFIIAICGLLYELLISTLSSYFQGSSVLHFSLVIGLFLSFMGVGSYLSRFLNRHLLDWFIAIELLLGLVGGSSTLLLYAAFSLTPYYYGLTFVLIGTLGILIGIEVPVLTRIVRTYESLRDAMAKVLTFDYLGALIASLLFPLLLLPWLGTMRTAFVIGMLNIGVALLNNWVFRKQLVYHRQFTLVALSLLLLMLLGLGYSFRLISFFEQYLYQDEILLTRQSSYQRIVMTKWKDDMRLFIDGNLQFSSRDEYRYHEALVHLPMALAPRTQRVLVLGGGDGLAAREILKHPGVQQVDLVDLDPAITELGQYHPAFTQLNQHALKDTRVHIHNQDAFKFVEASTESYDVIIADLPDPNHESLGKLYTVSFYRLLQKRLTAAGLFVTQSTSPYFAPQAFWCIHQSMEQAFGAVTPYTVQVPSFGQWGFNLAINLPPRGPQAAPATDDLLQRLNQQLFGEHATFSLSFLTPEILPALFRFDGDTREVPVQVNRLDDQVLVRYYETSWRAWR